jgi:hypothetical protein
MTRYVDKACWFYGRGRRSSGVRYESRRRTGAESRLLFISAADFVSAVSFGGGWRRRVKRRMPPFERLHLITHSTRIRGSSSITVRSSGGASARRSEIGATVTSGMATAGACSARKTVNSSNSSSSGGSKMFGPGLGLVRSLRLSKRMLPGFPDEGDDAPPERKPPRSTPVLDEPSGYGLLPGALKEASTARFTHPTFRTVRRRRMQRSCRLCGRQRETSRHFEHSEPCASRTLTIRHEYLA